MTRKLKLMLPTMIAGVAALAVGAVELARPLVGTSQAQGQDATWSFEQIGTGIKPALAVDADGAAHISFLREAFSANVYYSTNKSGDFVTQTAAKGYFYGPVDIDVAPDGVAMITYHDHEDSSFSLALGAGVVLTVDPAGLVSSTHIEHPGHDQWDADIAAEAGGVWHVAGIDPSQFGSSDGLEYATNASGSVVVESVGSGALAYEFGVSIEKSTTGAVGISYYQTGADDLIYAERAPGGGWTLTTVDADGRAGRYSDLAYDAAGRPHISYWVFDGEFSGRVRYAARDDAGDWIIADVGTLSTVVGGRLGARKITAIELDAMEVPHIMYGDRDEILYATRNGGKWVSTRVVTAGANQLGQLVEFDLDAQDRPHLVYFETTGGEPGAPSLAGLVFYGTVN